MLDVMEDSETIVGGEDRGAGFDLWSSLGGLQPAGELGVDGEEGQDEGGDQVGDVAQEEDHARHNSEN